MCHEVADDSLEALKLIPDWFVTNKMIKKFFNKDSGDAVFNYNEIGIVNIDFNNINLDNNFDEDDPDTIILIGLLALYTKFKKRKELKKGLVKN